MSRRFLLLLVGTTICWSSSFAFIKVVVESTSPSVMTFTRCALGALVLWAAVAVIQRRSATARGARATGRDQLSMLAVGALTGTPFYLIGWAEQTIDSGIAGIVNASVPIWAAALAMRWDRQHRTTPMRWLGVLIGFAGVSFLIAGRGMQSANVETASLFAAALGALLYAIGAVVVRQRLGHLMSTRVAAWTCTWAAALFVLPAALTAPAQVPATDVLVSLAVLGFLATGVGFLLYFTMLAEVGATRAVMVTYLLPPVALLIGWLFLDEQVSLQAMTAMLIILLGVFIGSRTPAAAPTTSAGGVPSPPAAPLPSSPAGRVAHGKPDTSGPRR